MNKKEPPMSTRTITDPSLFVDVRNRLVHDLDEALVLVSQSLSKGQEPATAKAISTFVFTHLERAARAFVRKAVAEAKGEPEPQKTPYSMEEHDALNIVAHGVIAVVVEAKLTSIKSWLEKQLAGGEATKPEPLSVAELLSRATDECFCLGRSSWGSEVPTAFRREA